MYRTAALCLTSLALLGGTASAHTLTVHRAKTEIQRTAAWSLWTKASNVKVDSCVRTSRRRVICDMRYQQEGPHCFSTERWSALLSRDGTFVTALASPNGKITTSGVCASIMIAPVDGDTTYDPGA